MIERELQYWLRNDGGLIMIYRGTIDVVDSVIRFLEGHKEQAVNRLFNDAADSYKDEWRGRDVFSFWVHLDSAHAKSLVAMACEFYHD